MSEQAISKRLKQLGMIEKEGYWAPPQELKPRDVERRRLFACEQLLERHMRKGFLHHIVTGNKKWTSSRCQSGGEKYLETLKWESLPHPPPYSPDVAPSHFHLTHLAQWHTAWLISTSACMKK
nr:Mariner Mos1 transposase [Hymenolepis microstoma]